MTEREILDLIRGLLAVVRRQQAHLEMLHRSHAGMLAVLGSGASLAADPAALEQARAEILELERLFSMGGDAAAQG